MQKPEIGDEVCCAKGAGNGVISKKEVRTNGKTYYCVILDESMDITHDLKVGNRNVSEVLLEMSSEKDISADRFKVEGFWYEESQFIKK